MHFQHTWIDTILLKVHDHVSAPPAVYPQYVSHWRLPCAITQRAFVRQDHQLSLGQTGCQRVWLKIAMTRFGLLARDRVKQAHSVLAVPPIDSVSYLAGFPRRVLAPCLRKYEPGRRREYRIGRFGRALRCRQLRRKWGWLPDLLDLVPLGDRRFHLAIKGESGVSAAVEELAQCLCPRQRLL